MKHCPCGSQKLFTQCCEPYIENKKNAETPEILMRSRYTAYTLARIDYIRKTMCKKAVQNFNAKSAREWAKSVTWLELTVEDVSPPTHHSGTVTFLARFTEKNLPSAIHEKSFFEKIDGVWFYTDGITLH